MTIDATDPRVLRLPWELLANESDHLFPRGLSERHPDLSALPPELASKIREYLAQS